MNTVLAQVAAGPAVRGGWGFGEVLVLIIIVAAVIAVFFVAMRQFGVTVPQWAVHILWIVGVAFLAIVAIRFLLSL